MKVARLSVAMIVTVSALTACAPTTETPTPLTHEESIAVWAQSIEPEWQAIERLYPGVARPERQLVVADPREFPYLYSKCMASEGYGDYIPVGTDEDESLTTEQDEPAEFAVSQFVCSSRYPGIPQLDNLLSAGQAGALYDYLRGFAEPCLTSLGEQPIPSSISRSEFVSQSLRHPVWSPFFTSTSRAVDGDRGEKVASLCPPEPAWLTAQRTSAD